MGAPSLATAVPPSPGAAGLRIPRTFHRIWLGGAPMPAVFEAFGRTWLEHHPGWELVTWTEDDLPPLRTQAAFDAAPTLAQKADLARYEVLLRHGGVYVDTDFECFRSLEPLLEDVEAFAGWQDDREVNIALLGGVPGHPLFAGALEEAERRIAERGFEPVDQVTGPGMFTTVATATDGVLLLPPALVYPYHYSEPHRRHETFPEAYAAHHWQASWKRESRDRHRWAVAVDLDAPVPALTALATFAQLFRAGDPAELDLVLTDEGHAQELVALVGQVAPDTGALADLIACTADEALAQPLDGALAHDDAAPAAVALATLTGHMHEVRRHLDACCADVRCSAAPGPLHVDWDALRRPGGWREDALAADFARLYRTGAWKGGDASAPRSGPGSSVEASQPVIDLLRGWIASGEVRSVVDVGCGDLTYMAAIPEIAGGLVDYHGIDVVEELVAEHRALGWGRFSAGDITAPGFRADADVVLVKDVLFHLSDAQVHAALENLRASRFRWLVTTSNAAATNAGRTFDRWRYAPLDLTLPPFGVRPAAVLPRPSAAGEDGGSFLVVEPSGLARG